jgi:hypothetical protein
MKTDNKQRLEPSTINRCITEATKQKTAFLQLSAPSGLTMTDNLLTNGLEDSDDKYLRLLHEHDA